jgi:hypothetical protein
MKVFLSYASRDRAVAERVCRVLEAEGHDVFFDRDDLGGGDAFGERIREAIRRAHVLCYLISEASVTPPSYALTELSIATSREPRHRPASLPVRIDATPITAIPAALRAFTILEPQGDVPAEIASAIERLSGRDRKRQLLLASAAAVVAASLAGGYLVVRSRDARVPAATVRAGTPSVATPFADADARSSDARLSPSRETPPGDAIDALNDAVLKRTPADRLVRMIGLPTNEGWSVTLILADQSVTKLHYRLDDAAQFTDIGSSDVPNLLTGQPRPNMSIQLHGAFWKPRRIDVKYVDAKGGEHGPFRLDFDPRAEFLRSTKQVLGIVSWVNFLKPSPDKTLAYFTPLLSYKAAFREIRYSVNSDALDSVWPIRSDTKDDWPARLDLDTLYVELPPAARRVLVRLIFVDGSMETKSFDVP